MEESGASFADRDVAELASLEAVLSGAPGGEQAGRRSGGVRAVKVRGAAGAVKDLQRRAEIAGQPRDP